jgi:hypothetical protein
MRAALLTAAACAATGAFPAVSGAATATGTRVVIEEGVQGLPDTYGLMVDYEGSPGEGNDVTVTISGNQVAIEDPGIEIERRGECALDRPGRVVCSSGDEYLVSTRVAAGDGDDRVQAAEDDERRVLVEGGPGGDTLTGGMSGEQLLGGPGDDVVDGGPGTDTINGGDGSDQLRAGELIGTLGVDLIVDGESDESAGQDTIDGEGHASLSYRSRKKGVTVDLEAGDAGAPGEHDRISGIATVFGSEGPDVMLGTDDGDLLRGHEGDDRLEGRGGNDLLLADRGTDRVIGGGGDDSLSGPDDDARDGLNCGHGDDLVVESDRRDRLRANCEKARWLASRRSPPSQITVQPRLTRRRAIFRTTCRDFTRCRHAEIRLLSADSRRLLGRADIDPRRRRRASDPLYKVVVRLNAHARKRLRRGLNVRVVIFSPGTPCGGCSNPRPATSGFTTRMKR